jgi:hypothetical protein
MNMELYMDAETIVVFAFVFLVLFLIGGIIGVIALPEFQGRFYISGIIFGAFGTGAGKLFIGKTRRR